MGKTIKGKSKIVFVLFFFCFIKEIFPQQNFENYIEEFQYDLFFFEKNSQPQKMRVLYSRTEDLYLIFYDKFRREIYVQFKKHKFDDLNEKIKNHFLSGQPYEITIEPIGFFYKKKYFDFKNRENINIFLKDYNRSKEKEIIYVFNLIKFSPLVINEIYL